jgi:branched-chain amino acid transport system permease protein
MEFLSFLVSLLYQYADSIAILALSAIGLTVIFSMMGVINMAHGEMMMIGAYTTSFSYFGGVPAPFAVMLGGLVAGAMGILIERIIIRRLYGQLLSSLVVTWGLSLVLSQGALLTFGPLIPSVPTPFGSFNVAGLSYSFYRLFLFVAAIALTGGLWFLLGYTRFGVHARATMENPNMARALGVDTARIYSVTFGLGTLLAGIAGGLFALTATIGPFYGQNYTPQAFITVVVGGAANIVVGLLSSVLSLGLVKTIFTNQLNILLGHVAMLVVAFAIIRFMPTGMSDWLERRQMRMRIR